LRDAVPNSIRGNLFTLSKNGHGTTEFPKSDAACELVQQLSRSWKPTTNDQRRGYCTTLGQIDSALRPEKEQNENPQLLIVIRAWSVWPRD
jgi:hypothetical protein